MWSHGQFDQEEADWAPVPLWPYVATRHQPLLLEISSGRFCQPLIRRAGQSGSRIGHAACAWMLPVARCGVFPLSVVHDPRSPFSPTILYLLTIFCAKVRADLRTSSGTPGCLVCRRNSSDATNTPDVFVAVDSYRPASTPIHLCPLLPSPFGDHGPSRGRHWREVSRLEQQLV